MARSRHCRACGGWHDLAEPWPAACVAGHFKVTAAAAPFVISDTMDPILSHADGRMYDSKSQYLRGVRAAGCYVVGNDKMEVQRRPRPPVGADIKRAIEQLSSR